MKPNFKTPQRESEGSASHSTIPSPLMNAISPFKTGISRLLNSRIDRKIAAIMATMCMPALLVSAILTIPGMVFRTPDQNAYYYFAVMLENDPIRWLALFLCAVTVVFSLAVPSLDIESPQAESAESVA